jgi:RNA polymerase sigma-70 factor, ECF subfamily
MHNQYVNTVRSGMRDAAMVDIDQMSSSLVAITDPTSSCQLRELERALARLPDEQREVILLVGLEGMPYDKAAEILNVPIGTVRSRLSRARERLRELMRSDESPNKRVKLVNSTMETQSDRTVPWDEAA